MESEPNERSQHGLACLVGVRARVPTFRSLMVHYDPLTSGSELADRRNLRREQERKLRDAIARLQTVPETPVVDTVALETSNLIDGMVSAFD